MIDCGSKPMVPVWGRCTTHFRPFSWGLGCSPKARDFDHGHIKPIPHSFSVSSFGVGFSEDSGGGAPGGRELPSSLQGRAGGELSGMWLSFLLPQHGPSQHPNPSREVAQGCLVLELC